MRIDKYYLIILQLRRERCLILPIIRLRNAYLKRVIKIYIIFDISDNKNIYLFIFIYADFLRDNEFRDIIGGNFIISEYKFAAICSSILSRFNYET